LLLRRGGSGAAIVGRAGIGQAARRFVVGVVGRATVAAVIVVLTSGVPLEPLVFEVLRQISGAARVRHQAA
jgi:hypothetical protein